ncbi:equilibrative nucleobase transporter 1 [Gastrophryne carolinensis]
MRCKNILTLTTGLVECICFAGVTFGWASLVFVLKKEKYFQDLCPQAENHTINSTNNCLQQDERFSLIFTVAAFMNSFMTLPCGYIFDRYGTAVARIIGILLYTTAMLLVAFSTADTAVLLFPALSMMASGGIIFIMTNMQVGNLFGSQRSTIITLFNGAFDSSSVIFLIFKILYENGISLRDLFLFISSCSVCHVLRTLFLLPKGHIPFSLPAGYDYGISCKKDVATTTNSIVSSEPPKVGEKCPDETNSDAESFLGNHLRHDDGLSCFAEKQEVSFWRCALSSLFVWHLVWLSLMQLRHYMFIGTLNPTITRLSNGDPETVSKYTNIFAVSQFCGVLCAPWNGLIMDRHKRKQKGTGKLEDLYSSILSLSLTAAQCILFSLFASIPILPVLYPTFIFQVLNRSFLYGGNAAFLAIAFPPKHFGKLYGLMMSLSAVISLLQYPALYVIRTHLHGDPFYINISLLILVLFTFIHPFNTFRVWKKEKDAGKNAKTHSDL